ncbi:ABC transporter substrate-binding protein [Paenibacillus sp. MMO-177]|uniref:ABC transporter substrate-binding protein n=1 Tax=Paenibacillus sp. MMO-177 TaxID=3081289 RepID=UPI00301613C8
MKKWLGLTLSIALVGVLVGCSSKSSGSDTITIATKGFGEQDILANIVQQLIEKETDLSAKIVKLNDTLLYNGIQSGEIDTYVEYTGTALLNVLKHEPVYDPAEAYDIVKEGMAKDKNVTVLDKVGFNDTLVFVMPKDKAEKLGITNLTEAAVQSQNLILGASQTFITREDDLPLINKVYGTKFKEVKTMDPGLQFKAAADNQIDIFTTLSTSGTLPSTNNVIIEDDKHAFVPYDAVPFVNNDTLKEHPELKDVYAKLAGKINDETMQKLNEQVDVKEQLAADVAKQWLKDNGLL